MRSLGKLAFVAFAAMVIAHGAFAAGPMGYSVQSNGNDHLYQIELTTGIATDLGQVGFGDAEGLGFAGSSLYAIGGTELEFWNITSPPGFKVGNTGPRNGIDAGMDFDPVTSTMFNLNGGQGSSSLYKINLGTGAATLVGSSSAFGDSLAISTSGVAYTSDWIFQDSLFKVDLATGAMTIVGGLGLGDVSEQSGMSFDGQGGLWALTSAGRIYSMNTLTGQATFVSNVTLGGVHIADFEGLACPRGGPGPDVPEFPAPVLASLAGLVGLWWKRRH